MAFCGKCGAQLHENATFCAACGTPTGDAATTTPGATTPVATHMATAVPGQRGFFGSLFDLSFTSFVTMKVIKVLFVLAIIGAALVAISLVAFSNTPYGNLPPVVAIILAPILFFVYVLLARVWMEILMVTFRIEQYVAELVQQGRNK